MFSFLLGGALCPWMNIVSELPNFPKAPEFSFMVVYLKLGLIAIHFIRDLNVYYE